MNKKCIICLICVLAIAIIVFGANIIGEINGYRDSIQDAKKVNYKFDDTESKDEGELMIGKIITSEKQDDIVKVIIESIFGEDGTFELIINKDTVLNDEKQLTYPEGYLISINYDQIKEIDGNKYKQIIVTRVISVEENKEIKLDPIEPKDSNAK